MEDITRIAELLENQPRNLCYFILGCNTNLRTCDMVKLKVSQVKNLKEDGILILRESKTEKVRRIPLNIACIEVIQNLLSKGNFKDTDFLLRNPQNGLQFSTIYACQLVKKWCAELKIEGNYGAHTPRKTWAYHQRVTQGESLPNIMVALNHSTQRQTLDYLCIQEAETLKMYKMVLGKKKEE